MKFWVTLTHIFQGHFFFSPQKSVITLYLVERSSLWVSGASTNKYTFKTLQVFLQLNWNHLTLTLALATIVDLKLYYPYSGSHDYSQLAASPRRRGLTVASRQRLCIFKQSLRDCDLTTVASRLWLYLFNKIGSAYLTKGLHITGTFGAPNSSSAASCAFGAPWTHTSSIWCVW